MIESIGIWLKSVITIVILGAFIEMILPDHKMKKYVSLTVGVIVLVTMIKPIISLKTDDFSLPYTANPPNYEMNLTQVEKTMEGKIMSQLPINYIKVKLNNKLQIEYVVIKDKEKVQSVATFLGIPENMVQIEKLGDENR